MIKVKNRIVKDLIIKNLLEIKTSFEDEGNDFIEVMFLKSFCDDMSLPLTLKLGGCEAIRDIKDANKLQIKKVVAPMVESVFGLEKFVKTCEKFYNVENHQLAINVESKQCIENIDEIFSSKFIGSLSSIVLGRGDLVQSYGLDRYDGSVDSEKIFEIAKTVFTLSRKNNLNCMIGGSMSAASENFVTSLIDENLLDKFETRNVIIRCDAINHYKFEDIIRCSLEFEINYLKYKRDYYGRLYLQDEMRIKKLSSKSKD